MASPTERTAHSQRSQVRRAIYCRGIDDACGCCAGEIDTISRTKRISKQGQTKTLHLHIARLSRFSTLPSMTDGPGSYKVGLSLGKAFCPVGTITSAKSMRELSRSRILRRGFCASRCTTLCNLDNHISHPRIRFRPYSTVLRYRTCSTAGRCWISRARGGRRRRRARSRRRRGRTTLERVRCNLRCRLSWRGSLDGHRFGAIIEYSRSRCIIRW